jgi:hypothetical protein
VAEQVIARIESVPASESETGLDEVYVVFDASASPRGLAPPMPVCGYHSSRASKLWGTATS